MDWQAVLPLILLPIAVVIGVFAGALVWGHAVRRTLAEESEDRRLQSIIDALGEMRTLLIDARPDRLAITASESSAETMAALRSRWARLRQPLDVMALMASQPQVRQLVGQLADSVTSLLQLDDYLVRNLLRKEDAGLVADKAADEYARAFAILDELGEEVRSKRASEWRLVD